MRRRGGRRGRGRRQSHTHRPGASPLGCRARPPPHRLKQERESQSILNFFRFFVKKKVFEQGGEKGFSKYFFENPAIFALKKIIF